MELLISNCSISKVVKRFVRSLVHRDHSHIEWPSAQKIALVKAKFERCHGIPQIRGAIVYIHIEIEHPTHERFSDLFDKNKNLSFVIQAIIDYDTDFLDIYVGWLGSVHDACIF